MDVCSEVVASAGELQSMRTSSNDGCNFKLDVEATGESVKKPSNNLEDGAIGFSGSPKSSLRAGLSGPDKRSWKCNGANLPLEESGGGLFTAFDGEKTPS